MAKLYKHIKKCLKTGCKENAILDSFYCKEHTPIKTKLMVNNPVGHNQHTIKDELLPKKRNEYEFMNKEEQLVELKRLNDNRRYYSSLSMHFAAKRNYLMQVMGIEKNTEAEERASKDFNKMEMEDE